MIDCKSLAARIQNLQPEGDIRDVARLCLLLSNAAETVDDFADDAKLSAAWQEMGLRLQAATDQHAAMTEDLERLAASNPEDFSKDQIWVLIRAIKVQSQVLQLYLGEPALDV